MNLDEQELIATRILNGSMSRKEIVEYVSELNKRADKFKKSYIKNRRYCDELEKDLFENCENYVINKSTIKDKITHYKQRLEKLHPASDIAEMDEIECKIDALRELLKEE